MGGAAPSGSRGSTGWGGAAVPRPMDRDRSRPSAPGAGRLRVKGAVVPPLVVTPFAGRLRLGGAGAGSRSGGRSRARRGGGGGGGAVEVVVGPWSAGSRRALSPVVRGARDLDGDFWRPRLVRPRHERKKLSLLLCTHGVHLTTALWALAVSGSPREGGPAGGRGGGGGGWSPHLRPSRAEWSTGASPPRPDQPAPRSLWIDSHQAPAPRPTSSLVERDVANFDRMSKMATGGRTSLLKQLQELEHQPPARSRLLLWTSPRDCAAPFRGACARSVRCNRTGNQRAGEAAS